MKAKIVLIHFPFTDLTDSKLRPALVLHESEHDVVVAFISSKIPRYLQDSDFPIAMDHPSFFSTGLKVSSVIKFDKIATVAKDLIEGEIGEITRDLADECNLLLRVYLFFDDPRHALPIFIRMIGSQYLSDSWRENDLYNPADKHLLIDIWKQPLFSLPHTAAHPGAGLWWLRGI